MSRVIQICTLSGRVVIELTDDAAKELAMELFSALLEPEFQWAKCFRAGFMIQAAESRAPKLLKGKRAMKP